MFDGGSVPVAGGGGAFVGSTGVQVAGGGKFGGRVDVGVALGVEVAVAVPVGVGEAVGDAIGVRLGAGVTLGVGVSVARTTDVGMIGTLRLCVGGTGEPCSPFPPPARRPCESRNMPASDPATSTRPATRRNQVIAKTPRRGGCDAESGTDRSTGPPFFRYIGHFRWAELRQTLYW